MAIKVTQWCPDTCGCVLEYAWDDSFPVEERVHTGHRVVTECELHSYDNDPNTALTILLAENQTKNLVLDKIAQGSAAEDVEIIDGRKKFLEGKEPKWSFDEERNLNVTILKPIDAQVLADLALTYGDKVKVK